MRPCAVELAVTAGAETAVDVTEAAISLGDDQKLVEARVLGGGDGRVVVEGNSIRFEGDQNGDVDVEYTIGMNFGGSTITQTGVITFRVSGGSEPPAPTPQAQRSTTPEFHNLPALGLFRNDVVHLTGRRLEHISRLEVDGRPIAFRVLSDSTLDLRVPEDMVPGVYDLVAFGSGGKATFLNALEVRGEVHGRTVSGSSDFRLSGAVINQIRAKLRTLDPKLDRVRCIVNSSKLSTSTRDAGRICKLLSQEFPQLKLVTEEPRATVKGNRVFARVELGFKRPSSDPVWLSLGN